MPNDGWRIIIDDGDGLRAVCKILPLSDGGYSVLAPYHAARNGWLYKHKVDYSKEEISLEISEMQHFEASDRVKLSHHWDGFVQFSGVNSQKIISGRNPLTGEPRGLAIMSAPMWRPITSGPTFGVLLWGPTDFKQVEDTRATDIIFHANEIYYERSAPYNFNAYHVEGWVFGAPLWDGVRGSGNDLRLARHFPQKHRAPCAYLEFRVLPIPTEDSDLFLGVRVTRMAVNPSSPSGFVLGGPSDLRVSQQVAETIKASYPKDPEVADLDPGSLDYVPEEPETGQRG
ncbi:MULTISPECIES: hypothetical protein [unclassified Mycobacterium]|uniref:hypothetical protein n=1 Tax=unclassified Mycobacterium TaxID=2642494 RepID=UPI000A3F574F|nr:MULTISPECIES: hypothetical protein [unclassified Mycobacterium]